MKCIICRQGETISGYTTVTLERDSLTLVIKNFPAQVCPNCGEAYVDEDAMARLVEDGEAMALRGRNQAAVLADIRHRRHFDPAAAGAPDSQTLLREDRER